MDRRRERTRVLRAVAIAVIGTLALVAGSCGGDDPAEAGTDVTTDPAAAFQSAP
jgi:hypothetical protein